MSKYLIPLPSAAMKVPEGEPAAVGGAKACRCAQELHVFGFGPQS